MLPISFPLILSFQHGYGSLEIQVQGCTNPGHNVTVAAECCMVILFVSRHCGPCFMSSFWCLEFQGESCIFGNFMHSWPSQCSDKATGWVTE